MFKFIIIVFFVWLLLKSIGLALKLAWGAAKIAASILLVIALPALILCLLFAGGLLLLIPVAIVGLATGILKSCLNT